MIIRSPRAALFVFAAFAEAHAGPFGALRELPGDPPTPAWLSGFRPTTALAPLPRPGGDSLVTLQHSGDRISVISSLGTVSEATPVADSIRGPAAACAIHANDDTLADLVASSRWDRTLILFAADGAGGFTDGTVIATQVDTAVDLVAADLDQDGLEDLVGVTDHDRRVFWMRRLPGGGFATVETLANLAGKGARLLAAPLDGDPIPDLAVLAGGTVRVFLNDGTPQLTERSFHGSAITSFAISDLGGTGHGLVTHSSTSGVCSYWENDGHAGFTRSRVLSDALRDAELVAIIDLDGDGHADLCSASHAAGTVSWTRGDGEGSFAPPLTAAHLPHGPGAIIVHDFTGDPSPDLVVASLHGAPLSYAGGLAGDPYAFWCDDHGLDPGDHPPDGDANRDGVPNLLAFASNLGPLETRHSLVPASGTSGLPVAWTASDKSFNYEFVRFTHPGGPDYTLWESSDLHEWNPIDPAAAEVTPIDRDWTRVRFHRSAPPSGGRLFLRLQVTFPPAS